METSETSTDKLLRDSVESLQRNLDLLRDAMKGSEEFNEGHSVQSQRLARAIAALMAEVRQDRKGKKEDAENLTPEQLDEAILESFLSRSPERRKALITKLRAADKAKR